MDRRRVLRALAFLLMALALTVLFIALIFMVMLLKKPQGAAPAGAGH